MAGHTTTLSTKGQVILPKVVRDQLQWHAGTRLTVEHTAEGVLLKLLMTTFAPTRPEDVSGCLSYAGSPKSVEEMKAGVMVEAKRRHARARYLISSSITWSAMTARRRRRPAP